MAEKTKSVIVKEDIDKQEVLLRKRLPRKLPKRKNDVYVNRKTDFKCQLARCQKLLDSDFNEIYIHGMGPAVNRAINLSLQLKSKGHGSIELSANTATVELTDDIEYPGQEETLEPETQNRTISAVHIKVYRPELAVQAQQALLAKEATLN